MNPATGHSVDYMPYCGQAIVWIGCSCGPAFFFMSPENILDKVKKLRELTGVGFKDCKNAIDENNGDIDKSIEFLRKKGIAKANKKMERVAADGLVCIHEKENKFTIVEVNSETDFVAKNNEFIKFVEEISQLALLNS